MRRQTGVVLVVALLAVLVASLAGVAQAQAATRFNVFAAASLNKAFPAEAKAFKAKWPRYKNVKFVFNFQGTDTLVAQIQQGAPADVFAGASLKYGATLYNANLIVSPVSFCQNKLCVIVPASNPARIATLAEIPSKAYYVAVGASTVPVGSYTSGVLDKMVASDAYPRRLQDPGHGQGRDLPQRHPGRLAGHDGRGRRRVLLRQRRHVRRHPGEAPRHPDEFQTTPLPTYPLARTVGTKVPKLAQRFVTFVANARGQKILKTVGLPPQAGLTPRTWSSQTSPQPAAMTASPRERLASVRGATGRRPRR